MIAHLLLLLAATAGPALAAPAPRSCAGDASTSAAAVNGALDRAVASFAAWDNEGFHAARREALADLACLADPATEALAVDLHLVEALAAFLDAGDPARRTRGMAAFGALLSLDPIWLPPAGIAPDGHPLRAWCMDAAVAEPVAVRTLDAPGVTLLVDGRASRTVPTAQPFLLQVRDPSSGAVTWTGYLSGADRIPGEALSRPTPERPPAPGEVSAAPVPTPPSVVASSPPPVPPMPPIPPVAPVPRGPVDPAPFEPRGDLSGRFAPPEDDVSREGRSNGTRVGLRWGQAFRSDVESYDLLGMARGGLGRPEGSWREDDRHALVLRYGGVPDLEGQAMLAVPLVPSSARPADSGTGPDGAGVTPSLADVAGPAFRVAFFGYSVHDDVDWRWGYGARMGVTVVPERVLHALGAEASLSRAGAENVHQSAFVPSADVVQAQATVRGRRGPVQGGLFYLDRFAASWTDVACVEGRYTCPTYTAMPPHVDAATDLGGYLGTAGHPIDVRVDLARRGLTWTDPTGCSGDGGDEPCTWAGDHAAVAVVGARITMAPLGVGEPWRVVADGVVEDPFDRVAGGGALVRTWIDGPAGPVAWVSLGWPTGGVFLAEPGLWQTRVGAGVDPTRWVRPRVGRLGVAAVLTAEYRAETLVEVPETCRGLLLGLRLGAMPRTGEAP